jgi:hypothetical protein
MPETPRSSFRLRKHTLNQIDDILKALKSTDVYRRDINRTAVIERAVDELHKKHCPKDAQPKVKGPTP